MNMAGTYLICFVVVSLQIQMLASQSVYARYDENAGLLVVIGGVFPIHSYVNGRCGAITSFGIQYAEAFSYFTQLVNSGQGPIALPGVKLGFEVRDTCSDVGTALGQTLRMVISKTPLKGYGVSVVVDEYYSFIAGPVANLLQLFQIPTISFAASAPFLSEKSQYPFFLRNAPPDNYQGRTLTDIVNYFNWTYVVAIHSSDVYGKQGITAFIDNFENETLGRCIANNDPIEVRYPGATDAEFDKAVNVLSSPYVVNGTAVVFFGQVETVEGVLEAVQRKRQRDADFAKKQFVWVGSDAWTNFITKEHYDIAQNVIGVVPEAFNTSDFDQYFQSLHISNHTDNPWFAEYWEDYFNCSLNGMNSAVQRCNTTNQRISTTTGFVTDQYVGHGIDALYAIAYALRGMQQDFCIGDVECNTTLSTSRENTVSVVNGSRFLQYLLNANFTSPLGHQVSFDAKGDPENVQYLIKQLQNGVVKTTGKWESSSSPSLSISASIAWNLMNETPPSICSAPCMSGEYQELIHGQSICCYNCKWCDKNSYSNGKVCVECETGFQTTPSKDGCSAIPVSHFSVSNAWAAVCVAVSCAGLVTIAFSFIVFLIHIKHDVVKSSSRELTAFLFAGITMCYLVPFVFIAEPSPAVCVITRFGVGLSFSTCFSPILVRAVRIHRIFNRKASTKPPKFVSPLSQVLITISAILVEVFILVIWIAIERPAAKYVFGVNSGVVQCDENPYVYVTITLGYNVVLLLCTLYFAFRTRNVPEKFNETKFINLTTYTLVIIWIAFLPIYFGTATLGPTFQIVSQLSATVSSATAILGFLVFPKVYTIFALKRNNFEVNSTETKAREQIASELSLTIASTTTISYVPAQQPSINAVNIKKPVSVEEIHVNDKSTQTELEKDTWCT